MGKWVLPIDVGKLIINRTYLNLKRNTNNMEQNKEYFVFISYSSLDNEWAIWLRHELEHYHLPASFNGRTDVSDNLRKVFRDRDELSAGPEWDEQVQKALEDTNNLIVICSPHSAKSDVVNKEIETFIALGKEDHIFPFIVEGDKPEDSFPPALRHSKLGGDVNKDGGRDSAFIKVVAGMLKVSFPSLWDRYKIEKAEEERKIREQRDKLLIMQSRFLAERAKNLCQEGNFPLACFLSLYGLPQHLDNPDRPYVFEAEEALRMATIDKSPIIPYFKGGTINSAFNKIATIELGGCVNLWDAHTGILIKTINLSHLFPQGLDNYQKEHAHFISINFIDFEGNEVLIVTTPSERLLLESNFVFSKSHSFAINIETEETECIYQEQYEQRELESVSVSPNKKYVLYKSVASGSLGNSSYINLIERLSRKSVVEYKYFNYVSTSFSYDNKYLAFAFGHYIHIMDIETESILYKYRFDDIIECHFCDDGTDCILFSCSDNTIRKWNYKTDEIERVYQSHSSISAFLVDKNWLVISTHDRLVLFDYNISRIINTKKCNSRHSIISFSKEKKKVLYTYENTMRIWDVSTIEGDKILYYHSNNVDSATFSPDRKLIASASDNCIIVWDVKRNVEISTYNIETIPYNDILISPNNRKIAYENTKGIWLIDVSSNAITLLPEKSSRFCFSNDGQHLLVALEQCFILYNTDTCEKRVTITLPDEQFLSGSESFVFSPDDKLIASINAIEDPCESALNVWDSSSGVLINSLQSDKFYEGDTISFISDNCIIANGCIQWDFKNDIISEIQATDSSDNDILSLDEELIIDGVCVLIKKKIPLQQLIDETYEAMKDYLVTPEERKKYYLD